MILIAEIMEVRESFCYNQSYVSSGWLTLLCSYINVQEWFYLQSCYVSMSRVLLLVAGHPIVNDSFYNSEAFGPSRGKGGVCDASPAEV